LRQATLLLIMIGAITVAVGLVLGAAGGAGEYGWYQCVASSGPACTASGNTQYYTVFLVNNDLLNVGLSVLLIGVLVLLAGIVTMYMPASIQASIPVANPVKLCPKCGAQVEDSHKFCGACGNNLA